MSSLHLITILALVPFITYAYTVSSPKSFSDLVGVFNGIIGILIPFIFALTFLTIVWGVIKSWVIGGASADEVEKGKKIIFVGVIALVVMSSIWGLLQIVKVSLFGSN